MFGNMYEIWIDRLPLLLVKRLMLLRRTRRRVWLGGVMLLHDLVGGGEGEGGCLLP